MRQRVLRDHQAGKVCRAAARLVGVQLQCELAVLIFDVLAEFRAVEGVFVVPTSSAPSGRELWVRVRGAPALRASSPRQYLEDFVVVWLVLGGRRQLEQLTLRGHALGKEAGDEKRQHGAAEDSLRERSAADNEG